MESAEGQTQVISKGEKEQNLESIVISKRPLKRYEKDLGFNRSLLEGQNVLNFGSGGSNISGEVRRSGINANVVDLDLQFDPAKGAFGIPDILKFADKFVFKKSSLHKSLVQKRRSVGNILDRKFVQGDGRHLPFPDQAFDTTLALWSTYQVPDSAKAQVWEELLRVSNALHCAPVTLKDYEILLRLAEEQGFEIIYSRNEDTRRVPQEEQIKITNANEYDIYKDSTPEATRIQVPPQKDIRYGFSITVPGNLVILKRK